MPVVVAAARLVVVSAISRRHQPPLEVVVGVFMGVCLCVIAATGFYGVVCVLCGWKAHHHYLKVVAAATSHRERWMCVLLCPRVCVLWL